MERHRRARPDTAAFHSLLRYPTRPGSSMGVSESSSLLPSSSDSAGEETRVRLTALTGDWASGAEALVERWRLAAGDADRPPAECERC